MTARLGCNTTLVLDVAMPASLIAGNSASLALNACGSTDTAVPPATYLPCPSPAPCPSTQSSNVIGNKLPRAMLTGDVGFHLDAEM